MATGPAHSFVHPDDAIPINTSRLTLSNGMSIPATGHGAMEKGWFFDPAENARIVTVLSQAIRNGLRLIDTAKIYATEELVGRAVRESNVPREEITIVTKLWNTDHHRVKEAFEESLNKLMLGYIDIYIMHWPCAVSDSPDGLTGTPVAPGSSPTYTETYAAMEALIGPRCRAIGVSNFSQKTLTQLLSQAKIPLVINQIEIQPLNPQLALVDFCHAHNIAVMAWGPLAGGPTSAYSDTFGSIFTDPTLQALAEKYHGSKDSVAALILSWLFSRGILAIPHSSSVERIVKNLCVVKMQDEDVQAVNALSGQLPGGSKRLIESADALWEDDRGDGLGRRIFGWTVGDLGWE